jgi:hypothetical protein
MALITLGANAITALPSGVGGKVLQVVTATKTDTFTATRFSSWTSCLMLLEYRLQLHSFISIIIKY